MKPAGLGSPAESIVLGSTRGCPKSVRIDHFLGLSPRSRKAVSCWTPARRPLFAGLPPILTGHQPPASHKRPPRRRPPPGFAGLGASKRALRPSDHARLGGVPSHVPSPALPTPGASPNGRRAPRENIQHGLKTTDPPCSATRNPLTAQQREIGCGTESKARKLEPSVYGG
jgi:hypothetical protein